MTPETVALKSDAPGFDSDRVTDYWSETRRPLASLIFIAPLLVAYEVGVVWLGGDGAAAAVRSGADAWMRGWIQLHATAPAPLLPAFVVAGLLGWQIVGRYPWRLEADTLMGMFAESLLFAFVLVVIGQTTDLAFRNLGISALSIGPTPTGARAVSFVGAGIYEEVLFRLCLLPACYGLFRLARLNKNRAAFLAALLSSLAFSVAHYVGGKAEPFELFSFTFRATAGMFFAGLFVLRGFGITVGCHAAYDLLVGVLLWPDGAA